MPNDMDAPKDDVSFGKLQVNVPVCTSKAAVTIHLTNATVEMFQFAVFIFCGKKRDRIKVLIW